MSPKAPRPSFAEFAASAPKPGARSACGRTPDIDGKCNPNYPARLAEWWPGPQRQQVLSVIGRHRWGPDNQARGA